MVKGFLIVSGIYRKDYFYAENEIKALDLAKAYGWTDPKVKSSQWFQYVNQHLSQPWLLR